MSEETQKLYLVNETIATHCINDSECRGTQDGEAIETVQETAEHTANGFLAILLASPKAVFYGQFPNE